MPLISDVQWPPLLGDVSVQTSNRKKKPAYGYQPIKNGRKVRLSRKPTPLEVKLLSLLDIPPTLDAFTTRLTDALTLLRRDLSDSARAGGQELQEAVLQTLQQAQVAVARYGAFEHRQEWARQGVTLSLSDVPDEALDAYVLHDEYLKVTASTRAAWSVSDWLYKSRDIALSTSMRRKYKDAKDYETSLQRWMSYGLKTLAAQTVNSAFSSGRAFERKRVLSLAAKPADVYLYSAVLDANTCDTCEELDGEEFSEDDVPDVPNPDCDGGPDRCRCVVVIVDDEPGWVDARMEHASLLSELRLARANRTEK